MQIATITRATVDDTGQVGGGSCSSIEVSYTEDGPAFQRPGRSHSTALEREAVQPFRS
jgi:hypothetical protein